MSFTNDTSGVLNGCLVQGHGTPGDTSVTINKGGVILAGAYKGVATNSTFSVPANTDPDFDQLNTIYVDSGGPNIITLAPGDSGIDDTNSPTPPFVILADIVMPASTTDVDDAFVTDKRQMILPARAPYSKSNLWYGPPPFISNPSTPTFLTTNSWVADRTYGVPFYSGAGFGVDRISVDCTGVGASGLKGRLGIWRDDGSGTMYLLVDAGQVALDAVATPTLTISETLDPGWWWFTCTFQSASGSKPTMTMAQILESPLGQANGNSPTRTPGGFIHDGDTGALPSSIGYPTIDTSVNVYPMIRVRGSGVHT